MFCNRRLLLLCCYCYYILHYCCLMVNLTLITNKNYNDVITTGESVSLVVNAFQISVIHKQKHIYTKGRITITDSDYNKRINKNQNENGNNKLHPSIILNNDDNASLRRKTCLKMILEGDANDECPLETDGNTDCFEDTGYYESMIGEKQYQYMTINKVYVAKIQSLRNHFPSYENNNNNNTMGSANVIKYNKRKRHNTMIDDNNNSIDKTLDMNNNMNTHAANLEYNNLIDINNNEIVLMDTLRKPGMDASISRAFIRGGPRKILHFNPNTVSAAIVTCGGLCPGLNAVIRELVHSLRYLYGVTTVYGIQGGFHGFDIDNNLLNLPPILLTNEIVENIHHEGGTILKSARGGFDANTIIHFLQTYNINQLYVIGGDGTHRAAYKIHEECMKQKLNIAIAGIPKTIDNDIDLIDRSFGFLSAVEAAQASIRSAKTEAQGFVPNCVGVVKLMGRSAGFLAAFAAVGSGDVDAVIIPEVPIVLDGPDGFLPFLRRRVQEQKYAVVVVAEGAGEELLGSSNITDAGGNKKLPEIGMFIRDKIQEYFHKYNETASIKYIDPSYTVRSVPANAVDNFYCMQLAQSAVHGCMAGYTGFSVGSVNNKIVYLPIPQLVATSPRTLNTNGQTWERVLAMTGQPNTASYRSFNNERTSNVDDTITLLTSKV